jgi:hypothetical protein
VGFCRLVDALPEHCLRRRSGVNPLVAAIFRIYRLLCERCSVTCLRRRHPGQAPRRQGRLQITALLQTDLGVAAWGRSVERSGGLALISAAGQRAGLAFERRASLPGLAAAWLIRGATLTDL